MKIIIEKLFNWLMQIAIVGLIFYLSHLFIGHVHNHFWRELLPDGWSWQGRQKILVRQMYVFQTEYQASMEVQFKGQDASLVELTSTLPAYDFTLYYLLLSHYNWVREIAPEICLQNTLQKRHLLWFHQQLVAEYKRYMGYLKECRRHSVDVLGPKKQRAQLYYLRSLQNAGQQILALTKYCQPE